MADYLNAIIHIYLDGRDHFKKFHRIKNQEPKLKKFETFAQTFPGADYINYYWAEPPRAGVFAFRRYLHPK